MQTYRSSTLCVFDKHCPQALAFHLNGVPRERDFFAAGIAAHAMMQQIVAAAGEKGRDLYKKELAVVCRSVGRILQSEGRSFDGVHEPPLSPQQVSEGRDIVWAYLEDREGELPPTGTEVEAGYAIDGNGKAVEYGSGAARYQALIDAVTVAPAVDGFGPVEDGTVDVDIWEYKTAWPTNKTELGTLQSRGQAVVVAAKVENILRIRQHVVNLRTGAVYTRDIYPDNTADGELLEQWRNDVFDACDAADKTREARPGVGCADCPWVRKCANALSLLERVDMDPAALATRYAVSAGVTNELSKLLRSQTKLVPVILGTGYVGYKQSIAQKPVEDAHSILAMRWHQVDAEREDSFKGENSEFLSLLHSMGMTKAAVEAAARRLYAGSTMREHRAKLMEELLEPHVQARFGIHRGRPPKPEIPKEEEADG